MQGSTFTITNLGAYGVEYFTPVLNPPETGIILVLELQKMYRCIKETNYQRRNLLPLSLTFDHRVLDGPPAANFLGTIKQYLEQPIFYSYRKDGASRETFSCHWRWSSRICGGNYRRSGKENKLR